MNPEEGYMRKALGLATLGRGKVEPNPLVGAVIVSKGSVVGTGYHNRFGGPHAEINALEAAGDKAHRASIYVTLEPCNTHGKTPPCTDALAGAGIRKVVFAARDPLQEPAAPRLKQYGIQVVSGLLEKEALQLNAPYFKLASTGLPYVTAKWAMTLDGRASIPLAAERWISTEQSRTHVQRVRGVMDVIMIGIGTVMCDDPELTCRIASPRKPMRLILDSEARIPLESTLVKTVDIAALTVATTRRAPEEKLSALEKAGCRIMITDESDGRVDLAQVLENLAAEKVTNVLLEGGPTVFAAAFRQKLVDKVMVYTAPKIVGDHNARAVIEGPIKHLTPIHFERITYEEIDHDILMIGHVSDQFRDLRPRDSIVKEQPRHTPATEKEALA